MPAVHLQSRFVIVGAGVFGIGTALELARKGYRSITVLDRALPPVADASSVDISRIVRTDYGDPFYAALASEAVERWSDEADVFRPAFHRASYVLTVDANHPVKGKAYLEHEQEVLKRAGLGAHLQVFTSADDCKRAFPALARGQLQERNFYGHANHRAGWADAAKGISQVTAECGRLGVSFIVGPQGAVERVEFEDGKASAVVTKTGLRVAGDVFVFATGAWTAGLLPMGNQTVQTGQLVGYVRLAEEEKQQLAGLPVYMNCSASTYTFPVHPDEGVLKIACHGWGLTNTQAVGGAAVRFPNDPLTSVTPTTTTTTTTTTTEQQQLVSAPPTDKQMLEKSTLAPKEHVAWLHDELANIFGDDFAARHPTFDKTVLCWYTVTPTSDFIVDWHLRLPGGNVLVATGGSGHAYKMLPVLGKYVVQALEGTLGEEARKRWALDAERLDGGGDGSFGDSSMSGPARRELEAWEKAEL